MIYKSVCDKGKKKSCGNFAVKIDFFSYTLFLYTSATYYQKGFIYPTVQKHEDSTFFLLCSLI